MIIVTTENVPNYKTVEVKGPAFGLTVRARGIGNDILAGLKGLIGGEISQYTEMLEDARVRPYGEKRPIDGCQCNHYDAL